MRTETLLQSPSQKFLLSTKPTDDWGPSDLDLRESWLEFKRRAHPTLQLNSTGKQLATEIAMCISILV